MTRLSHVQYHAVIRASTVTKHGPGAELFELTSEIKNVVWQRTLNLPGNAAFTLMHDSRKLRQLAYMDQHVELYREDRNGVEKVFRGKVVQPDHGAVDTVVLCWDYLSLFNRVRVDYYLNGKRNRYARKTIGFVVDDLFDRSIDADSVAAFINKGTIQTPKSQDDTTNIKTGNHFGIALLPPLLKVYYDLAEMSMTNTDNTVVLEVDENNDFNFWRDRRADKTTIQLSSPGTVQDFGYVEAWGGVVNDIATLLRNDRKPSGKKQMTITLAGTPVGINTIGRVQSRAKLGTLLGISKANNEKHKGKKTLAFQRIAKAQRKLDRLVSVTPYEGVFTQFPSQFNLGHNLYTNLEKREGAAIGQYMKLISLVAGWSAESGETVRLGLREKEDPD